MGHRGIYHIISEGKHAAYYTHWGACSPFSAFARLHNIYELQKENPELSIVDVFDRMTRDGQLGEIGAHYIDVEFERLSRRGTRALNMDFNTAGDLEMRVTFNFNTDTVFFEHNAFYHKYVGNFYMPLSKGLQDFHTAWDQAEEMGVTDYFKKMDLYEKWVGLEPIYEAAHEQQKAEQRATSRSVPMFDMLER